MWIKLSKISFAAMILYSSYIQHLLLSISGLTSLLGFLALFFLIIAMYKNSTPLLAGIGIEILLWAAFALTSLFAGYFVAIDKYHLISSVSLYIQYLIMIVIICFLSVYDGNIDYMIKILSVSAVICAVGTIFWGEPFSGTEQITMGAFINPNGAGSLIMIGIFCLLYRLEIYSRFNMILTTSGIIMYLYVLILIASRKSFLAVLVLLAYWFVFCLGGVVGKVNIGKKVVVVSTLMLVLGGIFYLMTPLLQDSVMMARFTSGPSVGDENRIIMYQYAFDLFKSSPLFGIGFNNFRVLSSFGTYSHSTYAELIACTGFIGTTLYLSAYITMALKTTKIAFSNRVHHDIRMQARLVLGIFLILVFLGTGIIHFYELNISIMLGSIVAFNRINYGLKYE